MKDNRSMIFGNTNHPVEIKKISIRIWKLRDHIKQLLAEALEESDPEKRQEKIKLIEQTYSNINGPSAEVIPLKALKEESAVIKDEAEKSTEEISSGHEEKKTDKENDSETSEIKEESESDDKQELDNSNEEEQEENSNLISLIPSTPQIPAELVSEGVCLLVDLDMENVLFFSKDFFIEGQTVILEFLIPAKFNVIAEITRSINYNLRSRIISENRPSYRMAAQLKLIRPGDRGLMRKFLASIQPDTPKEKKKAPIKKESDDFDDFDFA